MAGAGDDAHPHRRLDALLVAWSARDDFVMPMHPEDGSPMFGPRITGPLAAWRAANPGARIANVSAGGGT